MRPIWKGAVSFGLVNIPVVLYSATEDRRPKFKQLRQSDKSPIRYKRVAETDGQEVPWSEIVKGYEVERGSYVVFSESELAAAGIGKKGLPLIDVVRFVESEEIDPVYYKSSYYLVPEKTGLRAYRILWEALQTAGRVGVARFAMRGKQHLSTVRCHQDSLLLETMFWPDEIREVPAVEHEEEVEVRPEEVEMAKILIDTMSGPFVGEDYQNKTRENIEAAAQRKVEGKEVISVDSASEPGEVIDLLAALKASVAATKAAVDLPEVSEKQSAVG
ncbi:MAG: Ku protein [bacterium]|nr:Ku protein [Acidimicrobiia bacterium]MCY4651488.1 Ku protein [bacterium]